MPANRIEWANTRDDPEYHSVTFRPGPNIHEETSACGKVARFRPRVGIRMTDPHCLECFHITAKLIEQSLKEGGESEP